MYLMYVLAICLLLLCPSWAVEPETSASAGPSTSMTYPVGDVRNCQLSVNNGPQYRIGALPGGGFDNLRNLDMGLVHAYNYSLCQISPDGKYLLPDNVFLNPLQESNINYFSELFDHWDKYTDLTSSSINVEASFAAIHGKFSAGYRNMKTLQYNYKAHTTRTQV